MNFMLRHFSETLLAPRRSYAIYKAQKEYLLKYPMCSFDPRKKATCVHHILPFHIFPKLATESANMIGFCSEEVHRIVGHGGNYKDIILSSLQACALLARTRHRAPLDPKFLEQLMLHDHGTSFDGISANDLN
jgi:hypothetical protein